MGPSGRTNPMTFAEDGLSANEAAVTVAAPKTPAVVMLPVELLHPDPANRPNRSGDEDLEGMAMTIRVLGVLQPVQVEPWKIRRGHFMIRAGERRWRAAQMAGLQKIPGQI